MKPYFVEISELYGIKIGPVLYTSSCFPFGNADRKNALMCNVSRDGPFYLDLIQLIAGLCNTSIKSSRHTLLSG